MHLYLRQKVYELDRLAMQVDRQSSAQLMLKAAQAVWKNLQQRWPQTQRLVVLAGAGNNGGDAFAVAGLAQAAGLQVTLFSLGDLARQSAESNMYRQQWEQAGGITQAWQGELPECDVIVDGLLGIGLNKDLDSEWQTLIARINGSQATRVCIDIPSGLNADTGQAMPGAVQADLTVSFIGRKLGCYLGDGPDYCGERVFDDLGLSTYVVQTLDEDVHALQPSNIPLLPPRKNNSHKNDFGHVLVIGGDRSMSGATRLAAMAALRCGAGLVSVCVHTENYSVVASQHPELMVGSWNDLPELLARASVIVAGPGLGQSEEAKQILQQLSSVDKPMVVDADALQSDFVSGLMHDNYVLTPHPGEAARLLACSTSKVQQDRYQSLLQLNQHFPGISILKGAGTLVGASGQSVGLCINGHPGMATAGSGDVLAGMVAGLIAQHIPPLAAAQLAVLAHALAADQFALQRDANGLIASDIIQRIPVVMRHIQEVQAS